MTILRFSWPFFIGTLSILSIYFITVNSQCVEDQRTLLLQLRKNFRFNSTISTKLIYWNRTTDCCGWNGVTCDNAGHVIGLDLNDESISGGIENSSALFSLQFLQSLNLANNFFNFTQIPPAFNHLTRLTYLNLSYACFSGKIPSFSQLTRLVTLDLSTFSSFDTPKLEMTNLRIFVQDLGELMILNLDGVDLSTERNEWCQALSSSLPNLRVLSLSNCSLSGPLDSSLAKLQSLSVLNLSDNQLVAAVPKFFANFTNLTALDLSFCELYGTFPSSILQVPSLQTLKLQGNTLLHGSLQELSQNGSLQTLVLSSTHFSGSLPTSIGYLGMLSWIELRRCSFSGILPHSVSNLTRLQYLDLSINKFTGPIPLFGRSRNLFHIDLFNNDLMGPISSGHFEDLHNLVSINLRFNSFSGRIPSSLFALPSLQKLELSNNHFKGRLSDFPHDFLSQLDTLDLSSNNLWGPIPKSFFDIRNLTTLFLSSNNFSGTLQLEMINKLKNLHTIDLSYNRLSIDAGACNSSFSLFPEIIFLRLASCNLQCFPYLQNQYLFVLDLSDNQIGGEIPNWIWEIAFGYLNLSHNLLVGLQEPFVKPFIMNILDLHSNHIVGKIPMLPEISSYVDYSSNNLNSSLPSDIGNNLTSTMFFSVSNNNLTGAIPKSICKASSLQVLDLSNNSLNGSIPSCLIEESLVGVLNLGKNNLKGNISGTFQTNCGLRTFDLHGNFLEGKVPKSLANCSMLEILNLGNNQINDTFPCFLMNSSDLRVLVLRSNMFYGGIRCRGANQSWPSLQIIDIASNNFTGDLPPEGFLNLKSMRNESNDVDNKQSEINHLHFTIIDAADWYDEDPVTVTYKGQEMEMGKIFADWHYEDTVTVTNKGQEMELVKILTPFTVIDFSNNGFEGNIPETIGDLKLLYVLNMSHNSLTGKIPTSIGNLAQLGSIDLSVNQLSGEIPVELTKLTFLSVFNLSYNQLVGKIPRGRQFQTFSAESYEGNRRLCGFPLNVSCKITPSFPAFKENQDRHTSSETVMKWNWLAAEFGYITGLGIIVFPLWFCKRWRKWYYKKVDKVVLRILHHHEQGRKNQGRKLHRNTNRRLQR